MKNTFKIGFLSVIILSGCSSKFSFPILSDKIYEKNGGLNDKSTFKLSSYQRDARTKVYLTDSVPFLKGKLNDTLYLLEGYNMETAFFYGKIWNRRGSVNYSYSKGNIKFQQESIFTDYQVKLITQWDTAQIRKEEKLNGNWLDNNLLINAMRCFKTNRKWKIDKIYFKNFINPRRESELTNPHETEHLQSNHP